MSTDRDEGDLRRPTAGGAEGHDHRDGETAGLARGARALLGFVGPTTLLTALFLYFGYLWTDAFYEYFGLDAATLQFSAQDYMVRAVSALYVPAGAILLLALTAAWLHPAAMAAVIRHRHSVRWRRGLIGVVGLGGLLVLAGAAAVVIPGLTPKESMTPPLCVASGVLIIAYGRRLLQERKRPGRTRRAGRSRVALTLVAAVTVLCLFWLTNGFAQQYGRGSAVGLSQSLWVRPAVVLDTTQELFEHLPGVTEVALPLATVDQRFHYRYRGFRLLAQADDRMFLVSDGWNRAAGGVLMVKVDAEVRVQFAAG